MSIFQLFDNAPRAKKKPSAGAGYKGQTLQQVWGTMFVMQSLRADHAAIMVAAHAFNLTGARALGQAAPTRESLCYRLSAEYIQRHYKKNPNMRVAILGKGTAHMHCIIIDKNGHPLYDSAESNRISYAAQNRIYSYATVEQGKAGHVWNSKAIAEISIKDAVAALEKEGLWMDRAWSNSNPRPRGDDRL